MLGCLCRAAQLWHQGLANAVTPRPVWCQGDVTAQPVRRGGLSLVYRSRDDKWNKVPLGERLIEYRNVESRVVGTISYRVATGQIGYIHMATAYWDDNDMIEILIHAAVMDIRKHGTATTIWEVLPKSSTFWKDRYCNVLHINARHMRVSAEVGGSLPFMICRESLNAVLNAVLIKLFITNVTLYHFLALLLTLNRLALLIRKAKPPHRRGARDNFGLVHVPVARKGGPQCLQNLSNFHNGEPLH